MTRANSIPRRQRDSNSRSKRVLAVRTSSTALDTAEVHERIWSAIMDHSLPPETRLVEGELCEIFGLGRTRLRQVLQRLAHERVVTLERNRGAMVAKPTLLEAREVFAARRVIEAHMVDIFLETATRKDIRRLQEHVAREEDAWRVNERRTSLKLSGEFHLLLAEAAGNSILVEVLRDLVSRSSLIIAVYQSPGATPCPPDAHRELIVALERRDKAAAKLMLAHLDHIFLELDLEDRREHGVDLRSVFAKPRVSLS